MIRASLVAQLCNAGDPGSISGSGRSPVEGIGYPLQYSQISLVAQTVKNPPTGFDPWVGKIPWRREWQPTHFSWEKSPWTEEPGRLLVIGLARSRT